jgi:hypothetical protein
VQIFTEKVVYWMKHVFWLIALMLLITGCRNSLMQDANPNIRISMYTDPILPVVGDATLIVRLSTPPDNTPINNAQKIEIKADMTHAGMIPVLAETTAPGEDGYYRIPINFNMAGDWVITITATLADGTVATYSTTIAGIAVAVPNFGAVQDCAIPDINSTETVPDCIIEATTPPISLDIRP